jgi:mRNA-degrading endonuclease RelE of RelBE toxin-antitoxin system
MWEVYEYRRAAKTLIAFRLSHAQYRVIYKIEDQRAVVIVMDVTAHDYRRQR